MDGYSLDNVSTITEAPKQVYYTLSVPVSEQYFANGILHHNSGKTFLFIRAIVTRAMKSPGSRHAVFRFRFNAVKQSIILETLPRVFDLCFPGVWEHCHLDKTDWYLKLQNGSEIWFSGLDDKERVEKVLGKEYSTLFFNEASQIPYQSVTLALSRLAQKTENLKLKCYIDFNPPSKQNWLYRLFIERKNPDDKRALKNPADYAFYLINPGDNRENLDSKYLEILDAMPEKQRNRFLLGRFADASEGQMWSDDLLGATRVLNGTDIPTFQRVVVAIDPSGCSGADDTRSDQIGIVVAALGTNGHGYVIEDLTGHFGPKDWATVAIEAFKRHRADRIIGEGNYGGAMVEAVLRSVDADIPYEEVTASRGKVVRAEPVASLYELGKIHHFGYFPELEEELCGFTPAGYTGLHSPNRADAAIWALMALFPGMTQSKAREEWKPPMIKSAPRSASRYSRRA